MTSVWCDESYRLDYLFDTEDVTVQSLLRLRIGDGRTFWPRIPTYRRTSGHNFLLERTVNKQ